jgi:hypothetical protein
MINGYLLSIAIVKIYGLDLRLLMAKIGSLIGTKYPSITLFIFWFMKRIVMNLKAIVLYVLFFMKGIRQPSTKNRYLHPIEKYANN